MRMAWKKQNETLKTQGVIPNEGDFTKIGKKYAGKIDLLVGGTPCQDLSVAGKRAGFNGERSSLALDFVRLAYESQCKWFVWENVPGVFSSNNGRDFATLLSLFTGCEVGVPRDGWSTAGFVCNARRDRYGVAWRVLDGQFTRTQRFPFAVPQRRRRVFVVGCFGDWVRAAQVLLEPDRLSWNTPARIKTRERAAEITGKDSAMAEPTLQCTEKGCTDRHWDVSGVNPTLNQCSAGSSIIGASNQELFAQNFNGLVSTFWNGNDYAEALTCSSDRQLIPDKARLQCVIECNEVASTLTAAMADKLGLENQHVDQGCPNFIIKSFTGGESESGEVVPTLQANLGKMLSNQTPIICRATQQGNAETMVDACPTITEAAGTSGNNQPIICLNDQGGSVMQIEANGSAGTLRAN
ncbi:MAG: DNA cytosine methyltransferase, partial [Lentisphaeria bacterium]|nr:DNA cytosine methyltransferase [Lentisphaeria bacterium]